LRNGNEGIGKPEPLTENFSDWWSRRIDSKNRLIYRIVENHIEILQCGGHYEGELS
jgi:toxin YoeB